jgi:hypothetical protein
MSLRAGLGNCGTNLLRKSVCGPTGLTHPRESDKCGSAIRTQPKTSEMLGRGVLLKVSTPTPEFFADLHRNVSIYSSVSIVRIGLGSERVYTQTGWLFYT